MKKKACLFLFYLKIINESCEKISISWKASVKFIEWISKTFFFNNQNVLTNLHLSELNFLALMPMPTNISRTRIG
jgi:hypothetical protein